MALPRLGLDAQSSISSGIVEFMAPSDSLDSASCFRLLDLCPIEESKLGPDDLGLCALASLAWAVEDRLGLASGSPPATMGVFDTTIGPFHCLCSGKSSGANVPTSDKVPSPLSLSSMPLW